PYKKADQPSVTEKVIWESRAREKSAKVVLISLKNRSTISPSAMKIWAEAEGIARSNRERACSQPAANAGLVAEIDVAELALEIVFLAGDHAVTDDEIEQHQRHEDPQTVEGHREADQAKDHAEINRVAREAVRSVRDDRRCQFVGLDLRACLADRYDRPQRERKGERKNSPADPGTRNRCWNKSQGIEPVSCDARDKREYPCDRRANHCVGGVRVLAHLPCLGTSDGFRMTALPRMDGPARPRYLRDLCRTCAGAPSNAILADGVIHWPSGDCGEDPGT